MSDYYICQDCGQGHESYNHLHHPNENGGYCKNCGSDWIKAESDEEAPE